MSRNDAENPSRREFIKRAIRSLLAFLAGIFFIGRLFRTSVGGYTWEIDHGKCVRCGRCADSCVLDPSAVKCVHDYSVCGYCDLCFGYFQPAAGAFEEYAYNQVCPTGAIKRRFIEEPYFEYSVDEKLCIGCARCVSGCTLFGNGSMRLVVNHGICVNCNDCLIAKRCAGNAFRRVPASEKRKDAKA